MGLKRGRSVRTARHVDITRFNAAATPSLVGYWPCDEGGGNVLYDKSGNGFDLTLTLSEESDLGFGSIDAMWGHREGWISLKNGDYAVARGVDCTALDPGTNCFLLACELVNPTAVDDCDLGTAWKVTRAATGGYRGLTISTLGSILVGRASVYDAGNGPVGHSDLVYVQSGIGPDVAYLNTPVAVSTAFVPGDSVRTVVAAETLQSEATAYAALDLTEGCFALKAAHNLASAGQVGGTSIRNFSAWSFETTPDELNVTLAWLSANPGKLPKWWEGR